jgi:hypothetical protein
MGYSRDEQLDLLREAVLDLARGAGIHAEPSAYPALARLVAFQREIEGNLALAKAEQERLAREDVERFTRPTGGEEAFASFEAVQAARRASGRMPLFRQGIR